MKDTTLTNTLYAMTSVMDNLIRSHKNHEFKQLSKMQFNKVIKEVDRLNKVVNKTLDEESIEGFDNFSDEIMQFVLKLIDKCIAESE